MTRITLFKYLTLVAIACSASAASAAGNLGPENSTLHIGLRVLSGCELRTQPPRASCSRGTPVAVAQPRSIDAPSAISTGFDATALAGPAPAGAARITTIAF